MNKCYAIKLTEYTRGDYETVLYDEGIFKTKELAERKMHELAAILSADENRSVFDESDEDIRLIVKYSSCKDCPEYEPDYPCIGECYEPQWEFTLVEYSFIEEVYNDSY